MVVVLIGAGSPACAASVARSARPDDPMGVRCPAVADEAPHRGAGRFRIELAATFNAQPSLVFAYLHEPSKLRWLGRFRLVKAGVDARAPAGLGSTRRVSFVVPLVDETITTFSPPCQLDYEVTYSRAYDNHLATMRLVSHSPATTTLRWAVAFDSKRRHAQRHARFTEWYLRRALRRLRRHIARAGANER